MSPYICLFTYLFCNVKPHAINTVFAYAAVACLLIFTLVMFKHVGVVYAASLAYRKPCSYKAYLDHLIYGLH